jgi:hypothetical protein
MTSTPVEVEDVEVIKPETEAEGEIDGQLGSREE